jgi:hypothetical protein
MVGEAVDKIAMIQSSLRCFIYGLIGLLPGIGLPFACLAFWNASRARAFEQRHWNVAKPYRIWGVISAGLGTIFCTGPVVLFLAYNFSIAVKYLINGSD